jgi:hypothetical protein
MANKLSKGDDGVELTSHQLPGNEDGPFWGALSITLVLGGMTLGPLLPLVVIGFAGAGYWTLATTLAALVAGSMAMAGFSDAWCRFYLRAASHFKKGGVHLHFEQRAVVAIAKSPSMWCMHPHGTAMGFGFTLNGAIRFRTYQPEKYVLPALLNEEVLSTERQRSCDGVMAPILFKLPVVRNLLLGFGCCTPATKQGMHKLLKKGLDFGILPGGMEEVALYTYQKERVYLKQRAGFIKYALQYGYLLLPGYSFGECDMYRSMTAGAAARMWAQEHLGFVLPIFWGPKWYAPWLPDPDIAVNTVIGSPLQLPKIENPTPDDVKLWHGKYMESLREVFDRHKGRFGYADRELEIV